MTNRAVVFYAVDATDKEKRHALFDGIDECVGELVDLGVPFDELARYLEDMIDEADGMCFERDDDQTSS